MKSNAAVVSCNLLTQQHGRREIENTPLHALKKEANWLPFVTLKAERNPLQRRKLAELHGWKNVDLLLEAQSYFIKAHDHEVIVALSQCCFY